MIKEAMKQLMEDTATNVNGEVTPCITFRERISDDESYVTFQYGEGCETVM